MSVQPLPYALTLRFDSRTTARIETMVAALDAAGLGDAESALGYPPHVSLGLFDALDPSRTEAAIAGLVADTPRIRVTLTGFGIFPGEPNVLWLAMAADATLAGLHKTIVGAAGGPVREHYRPGIWTPHCTLAVAIGDDRLGTALALLRRRWRPIDAEFRSVELLRFPPVERLWRGDLRKA
ncbi:2'-5' RNA ligase family protein [Oceanibacterium hippocampi]|uniref:2',5' RNA ligase family n=1 Tax=Oceanibacterium hippocampi TaxID=745714 RepID=A0A1Y5RLD8_9PROT|nr:2'-5' RNA ligase family protein [Oceanibacterium hippocampi]SLN20243.1 hypothetical protein OCH7691_00487 [Oceanibacterium hippocampi]